MRRFDRSPAQARPSLRRLAPALFFALPALTALLTAISVLSIPPDPKNSVLFGYSLSRLALALALLVISLLLGGLAAQLWRSEDWAAGLRRLLQGSLRRLDALLWVSGALLLAGWVFCFLPLYRFGPLQATVVRLKPAVIWLTLFSGQVFLTLLVQRFGLHRQNLAAALAQQRRALWAAGALWAAFLLVWGFMAVTRAGIASSEDIWYESGVPVLGLQMLLAWGLGLGVLAVERQLRSRVRAVPRLFKRADLWVFLCIWAITALLWAAEPVRDSFFSPGPYLPNNAFHPYSDGAYFDSMSQYALIGQGIRNGTPFDRGLYPALLVFLHSVAGQEYARVMALQAGLYALLPAVIYLLGKRLYNRSLGVSAAALTTLRGLNAIASATWINGANPKLMLSDFPAAVLAALFTLLLVKWLSGGLRLNGAVPAGGVLGLSILTRTNALLLAPVALLLAFLIRPRGWRRWLLAALVFLAAMFASVTPWSLRNVNVGHKSILNVFTARITLVQRNRYIVTPVPAAGSEPASAPGSAPAPAKSDGKAPASLRNVAGFVSSHFLHNLATATLILPTGLQYHDLEHTIYTAEPYWIEHWDGRMRPGAVPLLALNLALLALGAGFAWKRSGWVGTVPLAVFLGYQLASSFARASGGRYIVPVDWVTALYFALGLLQVSLWGLALLGRRPGEENDNPPDPFSGAQKPTRWAQSAALLAGALLVGALLPLSEALFPPRYENLSKPQALALLVESGAVQQSGYRVEQLEQFLAGEEAFARYGRLLYPRYLYINQGIPGTESIFAARAFPRLAFRTIGPFGERSALLPMQVPPRPVRDGADVVVLGCGRSDALLAVVLDGDHNQVLLRDPPAALSCPLPEPVCDDNRVCR